MNRGWKWNRYTGVALGAASAGFAGLGVGLQIAANRDLGNVATVQRGEGLKAASMANYLVAGCLLLTGIGIAAYGEF